MTWADKIDDFLKSVGIMPGGWLPQSSYGEAKSAAWAKDAEPVAAPPPEPPKPGPPPQPPKPQLSTSEIRVVDCCGVYSWLIPWPLWKCYAIPVTTTRDFSQPYIYIYSVAGQLGINPGIVMPGKQHYDAVAGRTELKPGQGYGIVDIDRHINWDDKTCNWDAVRREIQRIYHNYRTSLESA